MTVFDQLDWAARTVQTVRVSRPGIHSIIASLPGRGHPKASLHAVLRKLEAAA